MFSFFKNIKNKKRRYINLPCPTKQPLEFNNYLRQNNDVLEETSHWILIVNSYIPKQLVVFNKNNVSVFSQISVEEFVELKSILKKYYNKKIYINASKDKSIPDRLHIHICL